MVVSQNLADEIEAKRTKIVKNPNYFLKRSQRVKKYLRELCNVYSFWLEHPELRGKILSENRTENGMELKKKARLGVNRVKNTWKYLRGIGEDVNFLGKITPELLVEVGKRVEPHINSDGFRNVRVSLGLRNYTPPNFLKVPEMVDSFCEDLKKSDYWPVEAAIATHLNLARIQPFKDGNKRAARLLQDRILADYELPPAVIPAGEREAYIDLLEQGFVGLRDNNLSMQRPFFDYIGGKVNTALDEILNDLNPFSRKSRRKSRH